MQNKKQEFTFDMLMAGFKEIKETQAENSIQIANLIAASEKEFAEIRKIQKESSAKSEKEFAEIRKIQKESSAKSEKEFAEIKQIQKETAILQKENNQNIGGIGNSNGDYAEQTIFASLEENLTFAGIDFDYIVNLKKHDKKLNLKGQFDAVLVNCDTIAIVELKYSVKRNHILELTTKKLDNFRKLFPEYANYNVIFGIGGMSYDEGAEDLAKEKGVGVIKVKNNIVEYHTDNIKTYYAEN